MYDQRTTAVVDRCADLWSQLGIQGRRLINAPEATGSVAVERFQNEPRANTAGDAGFNHFGRLQVTRQTPDRSYQFRFSIVEAAEKTDPDLQSLAPQRCDHFRPQGPELCGGWARPRNAQAVV